ncbi:uncharacterized protein LACBIDRAFT_316913 [Laccaria bicolor S238N-H82]|uniref:Predicted protein n=1 Tax=Laccaria bicolor (strain S238N-H82 / ATCC MYA-4686) TaxID=486041 RepID=B0D596_LACBS|nr:uncharacterized protein LACBIDRAFT_316913 [Laccaria bicolor S238N-H82]EDR10479.1 predicted protein [Laccaria bicolor S238N-H82]|eukprot:XP_001878929.1 predicted protein [Laccaria bicolor S238N-H82]
MIWNSQFPNRRAVSSIVNNQPSFTVGWVKNLREKIGPRVADLKPLMDPIILVGQLLTGTSSSQP